MRLPLILLALAVLGFGAYVRLAPSDPARWHRITGPKPPGDYTQPNAFEAVRKLTGDPAATLAMADAVIRATPRTARLAGSVDEGRITYVTRSRLWGFPDYTTVWTDPGAATLHLHGRGGFGRGDLGVNQARIRGWLSQLNLGP